MFLVELQDDPPSFFWNGPEVGGTGESLFCIRGEPFQFGCGKLLLDIIHDQMLRLYLHAAQPRPRQVQGQEGEDANVTTGRSCS